jgi:hypothetical protein
MMASSQSGPSSGSGTVRHAELKPPHVEPSQFQGSLNSGEANKKESPCT